MTHFTHDAYVRELAEVVYAANEIVVQKLSAREMTPETLDLALTVAGLLERLAVAVESRHMAKDMNLAVGTREQMKRLQYVIHTWPVRALEPAGGSEPPTPS